MNHELCERMLMSDQDSRLVFGSEWLRSYISNITFTDTLVNMPENAWDASEFQDKSVMAWVEVLRDDYNLYYNLYIGGEGGVYAPFNCHALFWSFKSVKEIKFNGCFDTSRTYDMSCMFERCFSLKHIDVSDFDTSQVKDISCMFNECRSLEKIDVRGI